MSDAPQGFDAMKSRLDEIVDEVSAEGISLDEALALYEEAVKLGLSACDVSEADILSGEQEEPAGEAGSESASASEAEGPGKEAVPESASMTQAEDAPAPSHPETDETAPF